MCQHVLDVATPSSIFVNRIQQKTKTALRDVIAALTIRSLVGLTQLRMGYELRVPTEPTLPLHIRAVGPGLSP